MSQKYKYTSIEELLPYIVDANCAGVNTKDKEKYLSLLQSLSSDKSKIQEILQNSTGVIAESVGDLYNDIYEIANELDANVETTVSDFQESSSNATQNFMQSLDKLNDSF